MVANYSFANDGGAVTLNSIGPATINSNIYDTAAQRASFWSRSPYLNFIRNPESRSWPTRPCTSSTTLNFTNNGAGVTWTAFDMAGTDYQTAVTMIDPTTGLPRLIFGNDQGSGASWTITGPSRRRSEASDPTAGINRNGNLQLTQFYYGAAQPSNAAAQIAGALFYGSAQDNGGDLVDRQHLDHRQSRSGASTPPASSRAPRAWRPTSRALARSISTCCPATAATSLHQLLPGQRRRSDLRPVPGQRW